MDITFPGGNAIDVNSGDAVGHSILFGLPLGYHAEAHHARVLGGDFIYSATITADWTRPDLNADLQFRISDEGRYGVRLKAGTVTVYRFMLEYRRCDPSPDVIAHCRDWPAGQQPVDEPVEYPLGWGNFNRENRSMRVTVDAQGSRFTVSVSSTDSNDMVSVTAIDDSLGVGQFGIYALASTPRFSVRFSDVVATADTAAAANFALLYSTPGYDAGGPKRALVRTLNDTAPNDVDVNGSSFTVRDAAGTARIDRRRFGSSGSAPQSALSNVFGFQILEADFSDLHAVGTYTLEAMVSTSNGPQTLHSNSFRISERLVTETMLWPLSIRNGEARRAADEDFRRNWYAESGREYWSVGLDGALVADRADDRAGATLQRIRRIDSSPISALNFRLVVRITIVHGCDAQVQFRVNADERWAVTLQAGDAGGCPYGSGPGAVRLHREGASVPGGFEAVAAVRMDREPFQVPFQIGEAYEVEVRCAGALIEVVVNDHRVIEYFDPVPRAGTFAVKAWASTARFEQFKVFDRSVALSHPAPGVWIPYDRETTISAQGFDISVLDNDSTGFGAADKHELAYPIAAQQHGFHDCNNYIGEVTSHGVFLSALMRLWVTRAHVALPADQERLRRCILTAVLYLIELYEQGNRSGGYAHQEPGRGAMPPTDQARIDALRVQVLNTQFAMYGLSSFAENGDAVDATLSHKALVLARQAWYWLDANDSPDVGTRDCFVDSIVAIRIARALQREGTSSPQKWFERAQSNAQTALDITAGRDPKTAGTPMADMWRPTLRSIPWFEGVYETFKQGSSCAPTDNQKEQIGRIAAQLTTLANAPNNSFCVIPQADDNRKPDAADPAERQDPTIPATNWFAMADLPSAHYAIPLPDAKAESWPVGDWYLCEHFLTAAFDCAMIGRLVLDHRLDTSPSTGQALDRLATGNLYWALGLNPGVPTTKIASNPPTQGPWSAASLVYNGPGAFARTIEGFRTRSSSAKGWLAPWEDRDSPHRETWWIDPANNGFQSIVNGHVLRERQWHYWSVGVAGWVSAETFMLLDGSFLKAATALEDWRSGESPRSTPYDPTKLHFFDTTHVDRAGTNWLFDDPDHTAAAQASRMATDFSNGKGFGAGRPTGHHVGELVGIICLPTTETVFFDVPLNEIVGAAWPFDNINRAAWAQAGRAAMEMAYQRGFGAGFFTGHQLGDRCGLIALASSLISIFDIDDQTVSESPWAFTDINTVNWAQAGRLATDVCIQRGFAGGFFTGHQLPNKRQIVAYHQSVDLWSTRPPTAHLGDAGRTTAAGIIEG